MKQIITFSLFAILFSFQINAQDKEELLAVFEMLSELQEVQDLYQHDLPQGRTLIFQKPSSRSLGRNSNRELINTLFEIRNEDLLFFSNPVVFMTEEEVRNYNIEPQYLTSHSIYYQPKEIKIILQAELWETREAYIGQFSFIRETEDDDWELNSRDFKKQRSR